MNRFHLIAVTGLPGAGKSTSATILARLLRGMVFNADRVVHGLFNTDDVVKKIKSCFGNRTVTLNGEVRRAVLANICFNSPEHLSLLEGILHPLVFRAAERSVTTAVSEDRPLVLDVPLLFESRLDRMAHTIIYVRASFEKRLERYGDRLSIDELRLREKRFIKEEYKIDRSDHIVYNNGDVPALCGAIERVLDGRLISS